jgi:Skp family chaperone for outer membrane proteins
MTTATHTSMHQDHQKWIGENDMWRCDISAWQDEFKKAAANLKQIETALKEHEKALQTHAAAIRLREQDLAGHEHALAEYERGESGENLIALAKAHDNEAAKHSQQQDAHKRIKRHHHEVMAKLQALCKTLCKAE